MCMVVEIDSDDKTNLAQNILTNLGNQIQFSNGCWVSLEDDNGMFWGVCPYNQDWGCNSNDDYIEPIMNWIKYWDEPRTETGEEIKLDS